MTVLQFSLANQARGGHFSSNLKVDFFNFRLGIRDTSPPTTFYLDTSGSLGGRSALSYYGYGTYDYYSNGGQASTPALLGYGGSVTTYGFPSTRKLKGLYVIVEDSQSCTGIGTVATSVLNSYYSDFVLYRDTASNMPGYFHYTYSTPLPLSFSCSCGDTPQLDLAALNFDYNNFNIGKKVICYKKFDGTIEY